MSKTKYPNTTTIEFNITDFSSGIDTQSAENITDFDRAVSSYNFAYNDGVLTEGLGFEDITTPTTKDEGCSELSMHYSLDNDVETNWTKLSHFKEYSDLNGVRQDKIILVNSQNRVFYSRLITRTPIFTELTGFEFSEQPKMVNYTYNGHDCVLFFNDADGIYSWDNLNYPILHENCPKVYDFCEYKQNVFAVPTGERLKIRVEKTNLLSWTQSLTQNSKVITLDSERGYINKLLSFNGYLFAIRDFGITRVVWYDNDSSYDVKHLLCSGSRIYANTACICGNTGLVLCKDGIYEFDNVSAQKLNLRLNRLLKGVSNQNAVATFRNGIYYIACRLNFNDEQKIGCENETGYKNNALIAYDTKSKQYSITRGVDIAHLSTMQYLSADKLYVCFNGSNSNKIGQLTENGLVFGSSQAKFWCSPLTDLGFSNKIKSVREISLLSLYDVKLKVFSESESREFDIKGGNIISRVPIRVKGKQIGISITSTTQKSYVSNLKMIVNLIDNEFV